MSDNPFSEPEDNDRTILRGPGGVRPVPAASPATAASPIAAPPAVQPAQAPTPAPPMPSATAGLDSPFAAASPQPPSSRPAAAPAASVDATSRSANRWTGEADALPKVGRSTMAAAAAPLLDLLARIGWGADASSVRHADELRQHAMQALQTFEAECRAAQVPDDQLRAGHYALCAALDDVALATPWGQSSGWAAGSLSSTFHQDVRSGERFFDLLKGLQGEPGRFRAPLEICYLCLSLGFRGRYRLDNRGTAEIERIREGLYQLLAQINGGWERELSPQWRGVDAPHRGPERRVPAWVIAAVTAAVLALGYVWASYTANAQGDAQQSSLAQLPPTQPPALERSAARVPPAATPSDGQALERLRQFLQAEIAQGLVSVDGDAQRLMVRIAGIGMFGSGSADIEAGFRPLLARVGQALKAEPGKVTVLGHSDNQPIRTVRFPSNFQLSAARAESAMTILAQAAGQPERFGFAGRADTEPLVPNNTAEGREKNRRIEVVLTRGQGR